MSTLPHLVERSGYLKQELTKFTSRPEIRRELLHERQSKSLEIEFHSEKEAVTFLDTFLLTHHMPDGKTVLEHFVAAHPELPDDEHNMVLGWKDFVDGVFEIERHASGALIATNLIDELTYTIRSNIGTRLLSQFPPRSFIITRIVPVGDEWVFSGSTQRLPASEQDRVYHAAYRLALASPRWLFRNPEKLAHGWKLQQEDRKDFIDFYGSDMVILNRSEYEERTRAYLRYKRYEARGEDGLTPEERAGETGRYAPSVEEMPIPALDDSIETIGLLYDETEGLLYLPDLARVVAVFDTPELAHEEPYATTVLDYIESPNMPPAPIQRLANQNPTHASHVFRIVLNRTFFSWKRDGEKTLRKFKPRFFDHQPLPMVLPIGSRLDRYANHKPPVRPPAISQPGTRATEPGRNDPCPCGSGKKYKKCCYI